MTLLEPRAEVLGMRVEELVACRKREAERGAEEPVSALLDISRDNLKKEKQRGGQRSLVLGVLLMALLAALQILELLLICRRTRLAWYTFQR